MKNNFIERINLRASKNLFFKEVKFKDDYYYEVINYLKNQKFLNFNNIYKILKLNSNNHFPIGNILLDSNNNIVGFMGTFYYLKKKNNKFSTMCNIHSWIVNKEFRLNSFLLLSKILNRNINFTAFTPIKNLFGLLEKFKFEKKVFYYRKLLNLKFFNFGKINFLLSFDVDLIRKILTKEDLVIFNKYKSAFYTKFIIYSKNDHNYVLIVGSIIKKKLNVFNIFYVSKKNFFKKNWSTFKYIISKSINCWIYSEFIFNQKDSFFPKSFSINKLNKKYFFSNAKISLNNEDFLNSDLVIQ